MHDKLIPTPIATKHRYKLRPGYGSSELLLEFESQADYRPFADDLFYAMEQGGFVAAKGWNLFGFLGGKCTAADLTFCSTVFFNSPHGALYIDVDEWDGIHGLGIGKNGQAALIHADRALRESGLFEKIEVDFVDYLKTLDEKEKLCPSNTSSGGIMKNLMLWLGFFLCVIGKMMLDGTGMWVVMHPTSFIMVLGPVFFYLIHRLGRDLFGFMKRVITGDITDEDNLTIERACSLSFLFGGVSVVMGMIHVMSNLSNTSQLGSGIAIAFVSVIYAAVPSILLLPVSRHTVKSRDGMPSAKQSAGYMLVAVLVMLVSIFVVLYALSGKG